jgi:hypothetical protein
MPSQETPPAAVAGDRSRGDREFLRRIRKDSGHDRVDGAHSRLLFALTCWSEDCAVVSGEVVMRLLGLLATIPALMLTGCAARAVSSHVELGADFANYRTYDWGPADALPTGDARLDNNEFFRDYIQGAIEKELAARRLSLGSNEPDLLIHWHTSVTRQLDTEALDGKYHGNPNCQGRGCYPSIVDYEMGTLLIDVVDAHSKKLLWRGWARENFSGVIDDQQRLRRTVVGSVAEMMKRFPKPAS